MTRLEEKERFIRVLATFLAGNAAGKSIALEIEARDPPLVPWAKEWAYLRGATPLFGYVTEEEAVIALREFLL